jgi:hypothetical protein
VYALFKVRYRQLRIALADPDSNRKRLLKVKRELQSDRGLPDEAFLKAEEEVLIGLTSSAAPVVTKKKKGEAVDLTKLAPREAARALSSSASVQHVTNRQAIVRSQVQRLQSANSDEERAAAIEDMTQFFEEYASLLTLRSLQKRSFVFSEKDFEAFLNDKACGVAATEKCYECQLLALHKQRASSSRGALAHLQNHLEDLMASSSAGPVSAIGRRMKQIEIAVLGTLIAAQPSAPAKPAAGSVGKSRLPQAAHSTAGGRASLLSRYSRRVVSREMSLDEYRTLHAADPATANSLLSLRMHAACEDKLRELDPEQAIQWLRGTETALSQPLAVGDPVGNEWQKGKLDVVQELLAQRGGMIAPGAAQLPLPALAKGDPAAYDFTPMTPLPSYKEVPMSPLGSMTPVHGDFHDLEDVEEHTATWSKTSQRAKRKSETPSSLLAAPEPDKRVRLDKSSEFEQSEQSDSSQNEFEGLARMFNGNE